MNIQKLSAILVLWFVFTTINCSKMRFFLTAHVRKNSQTNLPNIFTDTLGQDAKKSNLDLFILEELEDDT